MIDQHLKEMKWEKILTDFDISLSSAYILKSTSDLSGSELIHRMATLLGNSQLAKIGQIIRKIRKQEPLPLWFLATNEANSIDNCEEMEESKRENYRGEWEMVWDLNLNGLIRNGIHIMQIMRQPTWRKSTKCCCNNKISSILHDNSNSKHTPWAFSI